MKASLNINKSLAIRKSLIIILAFTLALLAFSACSWFSRDADSGANSGTTPKSTYNPVKTPEKIEGLYVGTCQELFADMRKNDKATSDDELYRAAAVILYSDNRAEEAATCCDNIKDENNKVKCKIK